MATGSVFICLLIILPAIALLAPGRLHSRLQKPSRLILAATDNSDAPGDWLTELMSYFNTLAESFAPPSKSKVSAVKSVKIASQDAVLVFGSTGKTGQRIVEELIQSNRDVVLVGRDQNKLKTAFSAYLNEGKGVKLSGSINLADLSSLASEDLFLNVAQVISCIGPSFQDPASNSENIDFKANQRIIELFQNSRTKDRKVTANAIILSDFSASERKSASGLTGWSSLDDSIMGGKSSSKWSEVNWAGEGSDFCRWEGNISPEGGVFCGTVNKLMDKPNIDRFDGIRLTIRGDGNRYKVITLLF